MSLAERPYHHGNLREELLETAIRLLETSGTQNLSLRELSRELGVSHTAPRRHFPDKQALLDALALYGFGQLEAALIKALKDRSLAFEARLVKLGRAYVAFASKRPALLALMFSAKHHAQAPPELLAASDRTFGHAIAAFAEARENGEIVPGDPGQLSITAFAAMQGLVSISSNGMFKGVKLDTLIAGVMHRVVHGLKPRK
jgi:AcrR family transcriptional regulator